MIMSTRNEKARRLNANEDNLLQMEMARFQKQHNKEMKSIILEKQTAKEAMNGVRRQKACSLLVARMVLQETNALNNCSVNSSVLSEKAACEAKHNQVSSKMVQGLDTDDDGSSYWKTHMLSPTQKESDLDREILDKCNVTSMPSKSDRCFGQSGKGTQTFLERTTSKIVQSSGTLKNTWIFQNPRQITSNGTLESSEYLNVPNMASKIDHYERSSRVRPRSFADEGATDARTGVEGACLLSGNRRNPITILRNLDNQYREQQGNSAAKSVPFLLEIVADNNRPKSRGDDSLLFKRIPTPKGGFEKRNLSPSGPSSARSRGNSPEPESFHSPLILRASLPRTPSINRRFSFETSKLFTKRSCLEPCHKSSTQFQNKLSPSRGIAKFRQTGSAAVAAQTLVSRYKREKAISNATENFTPERKREHHRMKED